MFTGLIEARAPATEIREEPPGRRIAIREPRIAAESRVGDSIAVSGCCLTIVRIEGDLISFEVGPETLGRTMLGELHAGMLVNLERSLRVGDSLGGHFVTGHVDAVGTLERRIDEGDWSTFWFRAPAKLGPQLASKGSIAVDGVSLTLVEVDAERFSVQLIPHTLAETTLGGLRPGDRVNIETDLLAKYVARQLGKG